MAGFADGVIININGVPATISAAEQQADHAVIHYTISPAVQAGDTVIWSYSKPAGHIVAESGGAALADVAAQTVTNNVAGGDPIGDALRADAVAYWTLNETSGTRADATGNGHDATILEEGGAVDSVTGLIGKAMHTEWIDDQTVQYHLTAPDNAALRNSNKLYIAGWIRPLNYHGLPALVGKLRPDPDYYYDYFLYLDPDQDGTNYGYLVPFLYYGGDPWPSLSLPDVHLGYNVWIFLEAYIDPVNNQVSLAVNAGEWTTRSAGGLLVGGTGKLTIGYEYELTGASCDVDEVGIYAMSEVPTQEQRAYLYNSGAGRALFPAP